MEFGLIPHEHWFQPAWIDEERAKKGRDKMKEENIIYGGVFASLCCMIVFNLTSVPDSVP